ncbi:MAG: hypothetical protein ACRC20_12250 [Segniliparus sp.]|uniref:hypothetical protein n=1 Tax=Segniliparus sp. TaxID=2804064 RepID=UPI003F38B016
MVSEEESEGAFRALAAFLRDNDLTGYLAETETALRGAQASTVEGIVAERLFTPELLGAALSVRALVGRLNDVVHASVIALVLPRILEPGETITKRPSLGAGNDKLRPYDLETDKRVAEFKVAQWKGADTMRKRHVFGDLVHLALDPSDRRAQLYTVGPRPAHYLRGSKATAGWAMGRLAPSLRARFKEAFGPPEQVSIADFTNGPARHVELIDLTAIIPGLAE